MSRLPSDVIAAALDYDRRHPNRPLKLDSALALSIYQTGASDLEIASEAGVCRGTVRHWRDVRGLPSNRSRGGEAGVRRISDDDKAEALRMLRAGRSLSAVASLWNQSAGADLAPSEGGSTAIAGTEFAFS